MSGKQVLLVEGPSDKLVFQEFFRKIGVSAAIHVGSPDYVGIRYNTKGGVINAIPLLVKQLNDGRLDRVAIVVDADHASNHGMGFMNTLCQVTALLRDQGFLMREKIRANGGFRFHHNNGLNAVGVWIMPDNSGDGGLEEWALSSILASEATAVQYAERILKSVPGGHRYVTTREYKARAAAWMSWQPVPGQGLQQAIRNNLIDLSKPLPTHLADWLKSVFP